MSAAKPLSPDADTISTGVRQVAAPGAHASETGSARQPYPLEHWDPQEEPESELPVPEGELLGGKYRIEGMFAEGGMGIVCLGRHVQLEQPVAVKFLRRTLSGRPEVVQRFLNEARALAALHSQHVVRVMDVGQLESGRPYLVMEHLDGIHLAQLLERDGPLSVETAVRYVLQVCEPLAEAHALGIVHRDIKPENLFLWSGGPSNDIVKVLDFGLAKRLGPARGLAVTGPQDSLGSPYYMSPEQITTPQQVDSRTDIWSLGVVLYQLVSNALPFEGVSLVEVFSHILNATPKPLPEHSAQLDAELDTIVRRCLEKAPEARYETMSRLADALHGYLARRASASSDGVRGVATMLPLDSAPPLASDAKLRIAGLHSRWPAALVCLLALAGTAVYEADRNGWIRLRDLSDGRLTPARFTADPPERPLQRDQQLALPLFRGVFGAELTRDGQGAPALCAVLERDAAASEPLPLHAAKPALSGREQAQRVAAYREYLKSQAQSQRELPPVVDSAEAVETLHDPYDSPLAPP